MNIISLFAGAGGLDLGFEQEGFNVIWANEFDKDIWETYEKNHPKTHLDKSDVSSILMDDIPDCDGIIGGPPCQSWSVGGAQKGIMDIRGQKFFDYIQILRAKQPLFFVLENVPGILEDIHKEELRMFLGMFKDVGYTVFYKLLNACNYRVPQDRKRVFFVGLRRDLKPNYFFPKETSKDNFINLRRAIGDLPNNPRLFYKESVPDNDGPIYNHDVYTGPYDFKYMSRNRVRSWDELSFTIQAQAKNEPIHPQAPKMVYVQSNVRKFEEGKEYLYRRLSVRECARIQSFPDKFKFYYTRVENGYKMVGNAVPPRLARALAQSINRYFDRNPRYSE